MEKTQTAVEWLIEHLTAIGHLEIPQGSNIVTAIISKAKEMEKEQIKSAFNNGMNNSADYFDGVTDEVEQYYNETYGFT